MVVTSSGNDVPNATAKSERNVVETPKNVATLINETTNSFELPIKNTREITNKQKDHNNPKGADAVSLDSFCLRR